MMYHLRERNLRVLQAYEEAHPRALTQGKTECCRSGVCCWTRPCQLGHDDPERIATHLGITVAELFSKYLVVDEIGLQLLLLPRRKEQEGGRYLSAAETFDCDTPCVFLGEDNACQIHDVKPVGGKHFKCWDPSTGQPPEGVEWTEEALIRLGWDGLRDGDCD